MEKRDDLNFDEFKQILQEQLKQVKSNIDYISDELNAVCSDDDINDVEDLATLNIFSKKDNTFLKQQQKELEEIKYSLLKIDNGTYGICEKSTEPICYERLIANPIARCTTEAQQEAEG